MFEMTSYVLVTTIGASSCATNSTRLKLTICNIYCCSIPTIQYCSSSFLTYHVAISIVPGDHSAISITPARLAFEIILVDSVAGSAFLSLQ